MHEVTTKENDHEEVELEDGPDLYLGLLTIANEEKRYRNWTVQMQLQDKPVTFKIDTGAQADVIPWTVIRKLNLDIQLRPTKAVLVAYAGHKIKPRGKCNIAAQYNGKEIQLEAIVADVKAQPILGLQTSERLGLFSRSSPNTNHVEMIEVTPENTKDIINAYEDIFTGLGELKGEPDFTLKPNAQPTVTPPRRIPYSLQPAVKAELKRMEQLGIIEKVNKPTDWTHPMVVVHKPGGGLRICIDPQVLNESTISKKIQMPTCEEILAKMNGAQYFTVLDANLAFWHKKLTERSSYLCTMSTPYGNYRFLRLPFGVKTGPEIFQEAMNGIYGEEDGMAPYEDDLIVWGRDMAEHNRRLRRALQLAREKNLKLSKKKMQLAKTEVRYLGHILTAQGVRPDPEKVETVRSIQVPQNKRELNNYWDC